MNAATARAALAAVPIAGRAWCDGVLRDQLALHAIAAPTGAEDARAEWVGARFHELGLTGIRGDSAGNVIGMRQGSEPVAPVVVCAHLDTVFSASTPLDLRRDGPRYVGPGIGDNARGLAAMLAVARAIDGRRLRARRPIVFVATTGEEGAGDLRGARTLFNDMARQVHAAVILDGPGDDRVIHQAVGARRLRLDWKGGGGHSWANFGVPNAVHAAAAAAARLASLLLPRAPRTTLTVARMGGGLSINAIPDAAWLEVDLRSTDDAALGALEGALRHAALAATSEEQARGLPGAPPLALTVTPIGGRPCGEVPLQEPLVAAAAAATRLAGLAPVFEAASTDANVPLSLGIPAVALGAGGAGGAAHTMQEWYDDTGSDVGLMRAMTVVLAAAGLGDGN
ncbi:MAG: M20/M25/M40 family metallo-hydrolase [Gemmatimonadetes bacterium]|nr:M20/M25/M40 family metallo-hydrolase [Gemmatimonadota bacterium]